MINGDGGLIGTDSLGTLRDLLWHPVVESAPLMPTSRSEISCCDQRHSARSHARQLAEPWTSRLDWGRAFNTSQTARHRPPRQKAQPLTRQALHFAIESLVIKRLPDVREPSNRLALCPTTPSDLAIEPPPRPTAPSNKSLGIARVLFRCFASEDAYRATAISTPGVATNLGRSPNVGSS
jgi:hypothetical protein